MCTSPFFILISPNTPLVNDIGLLLSSVDRDIRSIFASDIDIPDDAFKTKLYPDILQADIPFSAQAINSHERH
ncbi:MAG: hypothetical protein D3906_07945 [Candidatus Electrothrix sp. AUS1_2]|nr:hypothetical protein [Candidatus Electrothrix sp. AUS1_2]